MDKKEAFLNELGELSKKYGLFIGGCGCCDSPYVEDENRNDLLAKLEWDHEKQEYEAR